MMVTGSRDNSDVATVHTLNPTAGWLWEHAAGPGGFTEESLAGALCGAYEVDYDRALADVRALIAKWLELGLIIDD